MPDDVLFQSPSTGKVQAVPQENWDELLNAGYTPTSHKIMYSSTGTRAMVPNEELKDYMKQGYQTTPATNFEKNVTGEGISAKGAGGAAWKSIKGMLPSAPTDVTVNPFNPNFWTGKNLVGSPSILPNEQSGIGQMANEASTEYQRARAAGTNPLAAGYSAALSGAGPLVGLSDTEQQALAAKGEGGQIIGQSAVPLAMTALPAVVKRGVGQLSVAKPGLLSAADALEHPGKIPGKALKSMINRIPGPEAPPPPPEFPGASLPSTEDFYANRGEELEAARKLDEKTRKASARKGGMAPPPDPFAGMTSSATPVGNAPLPEVPQGSSTPFPPVQPKVAKAAAGTSPETSLLSRGRTLVIPGMEPDINNPVHAKMINDYQNLPGDDVVNPKTGKVVQPGLRTLAAGGDRFAAFVLRHLSRPINP